MHRLAEDLCERVRLAFPRISVDHLDLTVPDSSAYILVAKHDVCNAVEALDVTRPKKIPYFSWNTMVSDRLCTVDLIQQLSHPQNVVQTACEHARRRLSVRGRKFLNATKGTETTEQPDVL